ncbi:MAG: DNA cytosine methyltransferase [Gemmatimonadaceae bacterium]
MSFSDDEVEYEFHGNSGEVTKQIGNAVAVRCARTLMSSIMAD